MELSEPAWFVVRLLSCGIWIATPLHKMTHAREFADKLVKLGYTFHPLPSTWACIVLELGGASMILTNTFVWAVCFTWILFTLYGTWLEHRHVLTPEGEIDVPQYIHVFKNVSIIGGLCALIVLDPGKPEWLQLR
jgi:uncharacterized membrane protein YphA (DoxX/SURF4 family)